MRRLPHGALVRRPLGRLDRRAQRLGAPLPGPGLRLALLGGDAPARPQRARARAHARRGRAPAPPRPAAPHRPRARRAPLLATRDLLVVDDRGTGVSDPIACPDIDAAAVWSPEAVRGCAQALGPAAGHYGSDDVADDVEDVRRLLGLGPLVVYGVSYGTYLALTYMHLFPEGVRSVTVDSTLTPDQTTLGSFWKNVKQLRMPPDLKESEAFPEPMFTPTTKAETGHDEPMSADELVDTIGAEAATNIRTQFDGLEQDIKNKQDELIHWHSGYPGGLKSTTRGAMRQKTPERLIMRTVKGMLPHNTIGAHMLKKLRVYRGPNYWSYDPAIKLSTGRLYLDPDGEKVKGGLIVAKKMTSRECHKKYG